MQDVLPFFIIIPLLGFLLSTLIKKERESIISLCMSLSAGFQVALVLIFTIIWGINGHESFTINEMTLYKSEDYQFLIALYFDHITAVYSILSGLLTFLIARFSQIYLHRDPGFKRFFNNMLLYYLGIQMIIFSGNFETLLIGWEILGLSSFLLIAYYRARYLPVKNGFKVFSVYRLADMGILLTMWLLHHIFAENITFSQLNDPNLIKPYIEDNFGAILLVSLFIFLAASVKSAQFPFSSWLPRAMEGPTPSSSIFYGSIAVHIGVFLLLRTYPLWSTILVAKVLLIIIGITSALITSSIAKVQFSIKAQIGWSSMSQIGLMFVEIAFGLETLVLIHLCGNAFLRSYQLLNSPSVATYILRDQYFNLVPEKNVNKGIFRKRLKKTLYVLALNEYYMDNLIYFFLWNPFKKIGRFLSPVSTKTGLITATLILLLSIVVFNIWQPIQLGEPELYALLFAIAGLVMVLSAFSFRENPKKVWLLLTMNHFWIAGAVSINDDFYWWESFYYLSGVTLASAIGYVILYSLSIKEKFDLNDYYGHVTEHKWKGLGFLLCSLAMIGFPVSTSFLGEDLMLSHIREDQIVIISIVALNYMLASVATVRIYARVFLGPNHKWKYFQAGRFS